MIDLLLNGGIGLLALAMAVVLWRSRRKGHESFLIAMRFALYGAMTIVLAKCLNLIAIVASLKGIADAEMVTSLVRGAGATALVGISLFVAALHYWVSASNRLASRNESVTRHRNELIAVSKDKSLALSTVPAILYRGTGPIRTPTPGTEFLNDAIEEILGWSVEDLEASSEQMLALMHPEDRKQYEAGDAMKIMSQPRTVLEHRFRHKNGEYRWIRRHLCRILDEDGRFKELIGCGFDISDLKHAEQRLSDFLDSAPDAVITVDRDHKIVLASTRATTLFGYTKEELIGRHVADLVPGDPQGDSLPDSIPDSSGDEHKSDLELFGRRKDGSTFPAEIRISAIRGRNGDFAAIAFRDITVRKQTEAQLLQAQKMEAVGQLTGGIAHDFNNMLTVILGNLQMLETTEIDDQARGFATAAIRGVESASGLTGRLLGFSRQQVLRPEKTDLRKLLTELEPLLRHALGEDKAIELDVESHVHSIYVDAGQLENSLLNLAINARDAMPPGGQFTISAGNVVLGSDDVSDHDALDAGDYVKLTVSDTGAGISADALPHIFEPFYTTKEVGKGTGLGLSMVYGFVKQSRGHIRVSSELGKGTSFDIYMRRSSCQKPKNSIVDRNETIKQGKERILLVEDSCAVRETTRALLESMDYEVVPAGCAASALKLLDQQPNVDLLFTDLVMPGGMSGLELAAEVRKSRPDLKVLFATGSARSAITVDGQLSPQDVVLDKPYRRDVLARTVRDALDRE